MKNSNTRWPLGLIAILVAMQGSALAQQTTETPQLEPLDKPDFLQGEGNVPFELPKVQPEPERSKTAPKARYIVRSVEFEGNAAVDTATLNGLSTNILNRPVSQADLELLRQSLTRYYIDQGYVNSGVLFGNPTLKGDVLRFSVIEGRLTDILLNGQGSLDPAYITERLQKHDDEVLNVNTLRERFQLLLDDPLFEQLNARVLPGDELGAATLDLKVERASPYTLSAQFDNSRSPTIGSQLLSLSGSVRNLTGRGDYFKVNVAKPLQPNKFRFSRQSTDFSYALSYELPINYRGTSIKFDLGTSRSSILEEPVDALDIRSRLASKQVGLRHTLVNTLQHKYSFGVDYQDRDNRTTLKDIPFSFIANEVSGTVEVQSMRFWQEYTFRSQAQVVALRTTFVKSNSNLDDISFESVPGISYARPDYNFWLVQAQYAKLFPEAGLQLVMRFTGQSTDDRILTLDGLSIGGANSVRGYRENQLLRDNGYFVNLELERQILRQSTKGQLKLVPFIDYGQGWNTGDRRISLSSYGLSVRYGYGGFSANLTYGKRGNYPKVLDEQNTTLQDRGIHFMLRYDFL